MFAIDMMEIEKKFFDLIGDGPVTKGLTKYKLDIDDKQWKWLYQQDIYKPLQTFTEYFVDHEGRIDGTLAQKYIRILELWEAEGNVLILRDKDAAEYFKASIDSGGQFYNAEIVETKKAEHHAKCLGAVGRRMKKQKMIPPTIPDKFLESSGYKLEAECAADSGSE
jgi:hypothetical protein